MQKRKKLFIGIYVALAMPVVIILMRFVPIDNRNEYLCSDTNNSTTVNYTYRWIKSGDVDAWDNLLSHTGPKHPGCTVPAHIRLYIM